MNASSARLRVAHQTDVGAVRQRNEDAVHVDPRGQFFIVADGMGGHAAGDVASAIAVEVVRTGLEAARGRFDKVLASRGGRTTGLKPVLASAVRAAHRAILARAMIEPSTAGMGCTIEVAIVLGDHALIAHVGDSRTYLFRGGRASQLTRDHTIAPGSSALTNVLGMGEQITVDLIERALRAGDRLLLCSDGLFDGLAHEELEATVRVGAPEQALDALLAMARRRGGHDNATGVLVETLAAAPAVWDDEPTVPRAPPRVVDIVPANPLASVADDALDGIVEEGIHEETGPVFPV
jgi:serine/threonine protein phosphatase PrpC